MTEKLSTPERQRPNEAQETALRGLCAGYKVEYSPEHYRPTFDLPPDYVAGWIGGYDIQEQHPTLYVGCDGEGRISSLSRPDDDGHGPSYGCNYQSCGGTDPQACPFTKDSIDAEKSRALTAKLHSDLNTCAHEWRQVSNVLDLRFYCVHCLTITTSKVQDGIITIHNRGERWMD